MTDRSSDAAIEARLRGYLAGELRQAELDYPQLSLHKRGFRLAAPLSLMAVVVLVAAVAVLVIPLGGRVPAGPGSVQLGSDGLPLSIGGEPVLRRADIDARLASGGDTTPFLAGGYLVSTPPYARRPLRRRAEVAPRTGSWTTRPAARRRTPSA